MDGFGGLELSPMHFLRVDPQRLQDGFGATADGRVQTEWMDAAAGLDTQSLSNK